MGSPPVAPSKKKNFVALNPIRGNDSDWDAIERYLKLLFKRSIYIPLLRELNEHSSALRNSSDHLSRALHSGRISFNRGVFSGSFNARLSKELRDAGAVWDRKTSTFRLSRAEMTMELRSLVSSSASAFEERISRIDRKLASVQPEEIADQAKLSDMFDRTLWKTDENFKKTVKGVTVPPQLTAERRRRIADEWQENMRLYIKDFTQKEIVELREKIKKSVYSGNRYGDAVKTIQTSYGVSANKAKFLARQESKLLITKFQEVRYQDAGINEYTWHCVAGSPKHPVRKRHRALNDASSKGTTFRFDDPPVTSEPGEATRRNNPGQDYNCRCFAKPVVRFRTR